MESPEAHCGRISFTDNLHDSCQGLPYELTGVAYSHLSYLPVMAHDPTHIADDHFHVFGNSSLLLIHFCTIFFCTSADVLGSHLSCLPAMIYDSTHIANNLFHMRGIVKET